MRTNAILKQIRRRVRTPGNVILLLFHSKINDVVTAACVILGRYYLSV